MTGICPCCGNSLNIEQDIVFRAESNTLVSSDYSVTFSANESKVFNLFWQNRNKAMVVTKEVIFDHLYCLDPNGGPDPKVIDVMLCKIRRRLEPTNLEIVTVWGRGYFLRGKAERAAPRVSAEELKAAALSAV